MNIQKLIKIADKLDKLGFTEEAGFVDEIIEDQSRENNILPDKIEVPEDELDLLRSIFESLGRSLEPDNITDNK